MDLCKSKEMTGGRSRGLSQGYGAMAGDRVGAEGRRAVGVSVASGEVVQWWCSGARLVAAGVPVRMDDGSDTW
jgi:hypothetical protein